MKSNFTPGPWIETFDLWKTKRERMKLHSIAADVLPDAARLIASAPDLLSALERLTHPMADDEDLDYAREIIAKAKGGQQ